MASRDRKAEKGGGGGIVRKKGPPNVERPPKQALLFLVSWFFPRVPFLSSCLYRFRFIARNILAGGFGSLFCDTVAIDYRRALARSPLEVKVLGVKKKGEVCCAPSSSVEGRRGVVGGHRGTPIVLESLVRLRDGKGEGR